jgi:hypothetical protein
MVSFCFVSFRLGCVELAGVRLGGAVEFEGVQGGDLAEFLARRPWLNVRLRRIVPPFTPIGQQQCERSEPRSDHDRLAPSVGFAPEASDACTRSG